MTLHSPLPLHERVSLGKLDAFLLDETAVIFELGENVMRCQVCCELYL